MPQKTNPSKNKTYSSFSVPTLMKLAQIAADERHAGEFTIFCASGEFKAVFGQGAPAQASGVQAHDSLKLALVDLLVESPMFADEIKVTELEM